MQRFIYYIIIEDFMKVITKDFIGFLKEYALVGMALAFIMGAASKELVKSFVGNIVMPFINPLVAEGWETASLSIGPIVINWGAFLGELITFLILALVVFLIAKKFLKENKVTKK